MKDIHIRISNFYVKIIQLKNRDTKKKKKL